MFLLVGDYCGNQCLGLRFISDVIHNISLCLMLLGATLLMTGDVIGLGGQCWVAKLLQLLRDSPTHAFDWVATTPAVLAEILGDDGAKLSDIAYYRSRGAKGGHITQQFFQTRSTDPELSTSEIPENRKS